jgi:predicted transcriptional regulator
VDCAELVHQCSAAASIFQKYPAILWQRGLKDNEGMTGIQYVTDEKGRKVAVQIDLKKYREIWEDIQDVLVSRSRRHEKRVPLDKVKAGLVKNGKLPRG